MSLNDVTSRLICRIKGNGRHSYRMVEGSDFEYACARCRRLWINQLAFYSVTGFVDYLASDRYKELERNRKLIKLVA